MPWNLPQKAWLKVICREDRKHVEAPRLGPDRGEGSGRRRGSAGKVPTGLGETARAEPPTQFQGESQDVGGSLLGAGMYLCHSVVRAGTCRRGRGHSRAHSWVT